MLYANDDIRFVQACCKTGLIAFDQTGMTVALLSLEPIRFGGMVKSDIQDEMHVTSRV